MHGEAVGFARTVVGEMVEEELGVSEAGVGTSVEDDRWRVAARR